MRYMQRSSKIGKIIDRIVIVFLDGVAILLNSVNRFVKFVIRK